MATTTTGLATSFIQFSRPGATGGGATTTLSNGRIGWAGHNLLLASESFDSSSWTKTTTTVAANSHAAPNSTTTAETLTASSANGTTLQSYTALAVSYTFGVWLKRKTGTGNIQIAADSGTYTTVTITSDWALYTVTQTPAAGTISAGIRIVTSGDEVYAWGAHLYRSDLGGMQQNPAMGAGMGSYYPTTPKNLLGYTEDFSNAAWARDNTTVTANALNAPNGLKTADLLTSDAVSGAHQISQGLTGTANTPLSLSVYVKAGTANFVFLRLTGTGGTDNWATAVFDLSSASTSASQTATGSSSGTITLSSKTNVGDGWWRLNLNGYINRTDPYYTIGFAPAASGNTFTTSGRPSNFSGTTSDTIYLWGAQLSDSASLDTYVPQYDAAVTSAAYYAPRLDFDPVTLAAKGLLVEEQRTNIALQSEAIDTASWQKFALNTTGTPQWVNAATAPDGTMTADKIIPDTSSTDYHGFQSNAAITVTNGIPYTWSVYAKAGGYDWIAVVAYNAGQSFMTWFNVSSGTIGTSAAGNTAGITAVGNGWYRLTVTRTTSNTVSYFIIRVANADNAPTFAGDGTSGVLIWGAQLEAGSFATSYIPTGASTATRTADVASVSTQAFPYSDTAGTFVVWASGTQKAGVYSDALITENIQIAAANTEWRVYNGTTNGFLASLGAVSDGVAAKIAVAYTSGTSASGGLINGGTVATFTSPQNTSTIMRIGGPVAAGGSPNYLNGHIRQITYLPRRLTNAELQSRTA